MRNEKSSNIDFSYRLRTKELGKVREALVEEMGKSNPDQEKVTEIKKKYVELTSLVYPYENDKNHFGSDNTA